MSQPEQNERTVRGYYDAWNRRDFDATIDALTDDVELVIAGTGERVQGREAAAQADRDWADAFPDGKVEMDNVIEEGDTVVVEYTGRGTHTGILRSREGDIPPTGRSASLRFCDVIRLRDGKICWIREYFDSASLMMQLGLLPDPAQVG